MLLQRSRRGLLARLRNLLLSHALHQEQHVLWVDADILHIPQPMLPAMIASGVRFEANGQHLLIL